MSVEALKFLNEFKRLRPYDPFNIKPGTYDMKVSEDGAESKLES